MFIVRPIQESDLPQLLTLTKESGPGLTTLPHDEKYLKNRIEDSLRAFDKKVRLPGQEVYMFVLVDLQHKTLAGVSSIQAKVGGFKPFYTYKITHQKLQDRSLKIQKDMRRLELVKIHDGPSEVRGLFLAKSYRNKGVGKLLSLARFMFVADFSERFENKIITEIRGFLDETGRSPFWECVGRHFFGMEFDEADRLCGLGHRDFIGNLMPEVPLYIDLLPTSARNVIGQAHTEAMPAQRLLLHEGFSFNHEVDIFDAGPTLLAVTGQIRTIKESQVFLNWTEAKNSALQKLLLSNGSLDFKVVLANGQIHESGLELDLANLKNFGDANKIRALALK